MDIIVCIKAVPETNDLKINSQSNTVVREGTKSVINPFDVYAVEEGLRIREREGGTVSVVSMGILSSEAILRETIAMGADKAILLNDRCFGGSDTLATAYILSRAIKKINKFDLIICGRQSIDGDTSQVGPELAEKLNIPHITCVSKIEKISRDSIVCRRLTEDGYEIIDVSLPALITVTKGINEPRTPRIKDKLKAKNVPIRILNAEDIHADINYCGLKGSPTKVIKTFTPFYQNKCEIIYGTLEEKAKELVNKLLARDALSEFRDIFEEQDNSGYNIQRFGSPMFPIHIESKGPQIIGYDSNLKNEYRGIWIFGEQKNNTLSSITFELLGTGRRLADKLGVPLCAVIFGEDIEELAHVLAQNSADKVYMVDHPSLKHYIDELHTDVFVQLIRKHKPEIVLIGATTYGRSLAPRIASRLNTGLTADCTDLDIDLEKRLLLQTRPAFGGNLIATIICPEARPQISTVRPNAIKEKIASRIPTGRVIRENVTIPKYLRSKIVETVSNETEIVNLIQAEIIVSVGRGIGCPENIPVIENLAKILNGAIGATRAVVDLGWIDYSHQIGQTGKTVVPKIYIACGISGAIQHITGMSTSNIIIAINNDPNAPIFKVADYGVIANLMDFIPVLTSELANKIENYTKK
ncbi:hypothetical protein A7W90_08495 [Clostridium sp. Bc-iso-3]|nr:hypothetical protein A7W90_08495 [Clostridium sp. Bc-iso-3]